MSILQTSKAVESGISKPTIAEFVKSNGFERVAHSIYCSPDCFPDPMYVLQQRCPQVIFSHGTAMYLREMTVRDPLRFSVTVKNGYNPTRLKEEGVKAYCFSVDVAIMMLKIISNTVKFTVGNSAEIQKVIMKDEVPTGKIIINKSGEFLSDVSVLDSATGWIGNTFSFITGGLKDVTFGVYAFDDIKQADGVSPDYYTAGTQIGTITTDSTGVATMENPPRSGSSRIFDSSWAIRAFGADNFAIGKVALDATW